MRYERKAIPYLAAVAIMIADQVLVSSQQVQDYEKFGKEVQNCLYSEAPVGSAEPGSTEISVLGQLQEDESLSAEHRLSQFKFCVSSTANGDDIEAILDSIELYLSKPTSEDP